MFSLVLYHFIRLYLPLQGQNRKNEITTISSQHSLNVLAIDEPLEYARLALDGEMQVRVDASLHSNNNILKKLFA